MSEYFWKMTKETPCLFPALVPGIGATFTHVDTADLVVLMVQEPLNVLGLSWPGDGAAIRIPDHTGILQNQTRAVRGFRYGPGEYCIIQASSTRCSRD